MRFAVLLILTILFQSSLSKIHNILECVGHDSNCVVLYCDAESETKFEEGRDGVDCIDPEKLDGKYEEISFIRASQFSNNSLTGKFVHELASKNDPIRRKIVSARQLSHLMKHKIQFLVNGIWLEQAVDESLFPIVSIRNSTENELEVLYLDCSLADINLQFLDLFDFASIFVFWLIILEGSIFLVLLLIGIVKYGCPTDLDNMLTFKLLIFNGFRHIGSIFYFFSTFFAVYLSYFFNLILITIFLYLIVRGRTDNKRSRLKFYLFSIVIFVCLCVVPFYICKFSLSIVSIAVYIISKLWIPFMLYNDEFMEDTLPEESEQLFEIFLHSLHTSLIFFGFLSTLTTINGINFWMCEFGLLKILMFCRKVFSILLHFFYSFMISCLLEEITKIPLVSPIFQCVTIFYDWLHFGYSHKRRRRSGYPKCPDFEKTKRLEETWNRIKFWRRTAEIYECQNDCPVLQIDWFERHLMDIGVKEETYEYYRAKQNKKNEECLDEEKWSRMKEIEKKDQPNPRDSDDEVLDIE